MDAIVAEIAARCRSAGLDLAQPFRVEWYNDAVAPEYRLDDLGRPGALGILIANTRALWPCFIDALRTEPARLASADPLDDYVVEVVTSACRGRFAIGWAHTPQPKRVAMQRLAHTSGLAHLGASHLNVHPVYGPWIGLRAAIVLDLEGPTGPAPALVSPCPEWEAEAPLRVARAQAVGTWEGWGELRASCPLGREHRYSDDQLRYHSTKDRAVLLRSCMAPR